MWRTYKYYDYDKNPEVDVFDITKVNNFLRKYKLFAIQSRKLTRFDREGIPLLNRVFYLKKPLNIGLVDAYDVPDRWKVKYAEGSDLVIKANTKIKFLKIGKVSYTVHIDGQTLEIPESVFNNKFIEVLK